MNRTFRTLTSEEIRRVSCPVCEAPTGSPCSEPVTGARLGHHHLDQVALARSQQRRSDYADNAKRQRVADRMYRP